MTFFAKIILHFRDNCLQKTYDNDEIVKGKTFQQHVKQGTVFGKIF